MALKSINPVNGQLLKEYNEYSSEIITRRIAAAQVCYEKWRETPFSYRAKLLQRCAEQLVNSRHEYARLISMEMGKPINESIAEIEKCAWVCQYYAENGAAFLKKQLVETDATHSYIHYEPLGVILAIMPWNFPFWQVFRFAAPAIMAGNTVLLKHASNVSGCALAIEEVFQYADAPAGLFTTLLVASDNVAEVIEHSDVKAITLTGSEKAGAAVAAQAGKMIKKTVMELGGSDPFVVLEDADLKKAAETAVKARFINNGQSCIAAKRFIIHKTIVKEFIRLVEDEVNKLVVGDPLDDKTNLGPMARVDLAETVLSQIQKSIDNGAHLLLGGTTGDQGDTFVKPTILLNVKRGMPVYDEEVFGPVLPIIEAENEEDCIRIANDTVYGLGASVWSNDIERAQKVASRIEAGCVFINGLVKSDPRLPFGGIKLSGYGRELSEVGIREFVNIKSIWIK